MTAFPLALKAKSTLRGTAPGKFENTTKTLAILDLCLSKAWAVEFTMNIVTSSFSKSFVLKMFSAPTKTQNRRFQILTVSRALTKTSVFVAD